MKIGEKLRIIRKELGNINQAEFAKQLGVSERTYQNYEVNETPVKLEVIEKLINQFNIRPNWLFKSKGDIFFKQEDKTSLTPEQQLMAAYGLSDYEINLIKEKKQKTINDIENIIESVKNAT